MLDHILNRLQIRSEDESKKKPVLQWIIHCVYLGSICVQSHLHYSYSPIYSYNLCGIRSSSFCFVQRDIVQLHSLRHATSEHKQMPSTEWQSERERESVIAFAFSRIHVCKRCVCIIRTLTRTAQMWRFYFNVNNRISGSTLTFVSNCSNMAAAAGVVVDDDHDNDDGDVDIISSIHYRYIVLDALRRFCEPEIIQQLFAYNMLRARNKIFAHMDWSTTTAESKPLFRRRHGICTRCMCIVYYMYSWDRVARSSSWWILVETNIRIGLIFRINLCAERSTRFN